jgi:hypothetical protein
VSLLALLVKRRIGFSIQQLKGIAISSFMVAKKHTRLVLQINGIDNPLRPVNINTNMELGSGLFGKIRQKGASR